MDITQEEQQRKEFCDILFSLADSQIALKEKSERSRIYQRLEKLYYINGCEENYRHFYSDIFLVLTQIQQGNMPGNIDILGQNIIEIRKGYQAKNTDSEGNLIDISDNIKKLYDHVSLDIARLSYSDALNWKISGEEAIEKLQSQMNNLKSDIEKANISQAEIEKDMKDQQKDYVTILGIFAAIMLAFVGGITFSSSVLQHMACVSIFRLLVVIDFLGFVLINTIYLLMKFIFVINGHDTELFKIKCINIFFSVVGMLIIGSWFIFK